MKLSTFMLEERFFKIQTPINASREIALSVDFKDTEFDRFEIGLHTISFYIGEDRVCELAHVKGKMVGNDKRGGKLFWNPPQQLDLGLIDFGNQKERNQST